MINHGTLHVVCYVSLESLSGGAYKADVLKQHVIMLSTLFSVQFIPLSLMLKLSSFLQRQYIVMSYSNERLRFLFCNEITFLHSRL